MCVPALYFRPLRPHTIVVACVAALGAPCRRTREGRFEAPTPFLSRFIIDIISMTMNQRQRAGRRREPADSFSRATRVQDEPWRFSGQNRVGHGMTIEPKSVLNRG